MCQEPNCRPIDPDVLHELKRADVDAWSKIVQELNLSLKQRARRYLGHDEAAVQDAVQEGWRACWKAIVGSERNVLFRSYFIVAVQNAARRRAKKDGGQGGSLNQPPPGDPDGPPPIGQIEDPSNPKWLQELREYLKPALGCLDDLQRAVIECRFFEQMTCAETAMELELTVHRVAYAQRIALEKMRDFLERDERASTT